MKRHLTVAGLAVLLAVVVGITGCKSVKEEPIKPSFDTGQTKTSIKPSGRTAKTSGQPGSDIETVQIAEPKLDQEPQPEARQWPLAGSGELRTVYFDFDKADLTPKARADLEYNAQKLNEHKSVRVLIEGHCDERGTIEYNLALGERRALAVRNYLINLGVDANRLATISYGEEKPVDNRHNEEAWAKNRRAEFNVTAE